MKLSLIALQIVGGLTLVPYPFLLIANVMSIAAEGQTLVGAIPYLVATVYPALWICLWVLAWRAMASGAVILAFALSSIPALSCLVAIGVFISDNKATKAQYSKLAADAKNKVEAANPLLWIILCQGASNRLPFPQYGTVEQVLQAIDDNPTLVNVAVPEYGSPLNNAVMDVGVNIDGTFRGTGQERIVRALVAHGAKLAPDERDILWRTFQLRRALYEGPVTTESENPLVWRIVKRESNDTSPIALRPEEIPLLNTTTSLHGSPMYALLLKNGHYFFPELWKAGARLTAEESRDPAASKALAEMLARWHELSHR